MLGSPAAILLTVGLLLSEPPLVLHGGEAPTKLFIVHGSMNVSAAPAWIAKSQGFFRKYGFEVDPVFVIGGRAAQAMIAGQAPFGFIGVTHIANALTGGADLKMILGLTTTLHYVLLSRPAIKTIEDLRGKKIGIGTPAGPPSLAAYLALDYAGLHPQRDQIVLLQVGGVPERLSALQTGSVDAATVPPALAQTMMANGYNVLLDIAKAKIAFYSSGLVTSARTIRSNGAQVENMAKAIIEATAYIHNPANKKTVAQILAKHLRLDKADLIERTYQELLMEVPRKPCPRYEGAASVLKLMAQYGLNPKAAQLRPEDVIDTELCKKLDDSGFIDTIERNQ
jgi:ABC-type nitrate/sulfonate/bicarbonate transport system substrate-binding protein